MSTNALELLKNNIDFQQELDSLKSLRSKEILEANELGCAMEFEYANNKKKFLILTRSEMMKH